MRIDLHTHTTFSDGTLSPDDLVAEAVRNEVIVLAVTDHDTLLGVAPTLKAASSENLTVVPGVELSIDMEVRNNGYIHLLGLFIDPEHAPLRSRLKQLREARDRRNRVILEKLHNLGLPITESELEAQAGQGSAGRPHIASLMQQKGYVSSLKEAFEKYLQEGAPAHADREKLRFAEACDLIHQAGGLAILAHPVSLNITDEMELEKMMLKLRSMGMDGIEVYSSFHPRTFSERLQIIAEVHGLLLSGGSDFHGETKPGIHLGRGSGNLNIPVKIFEDLRKAVKDRYRS